MSGTVGMDIGSRCMVLGKPDIGSIRQTKTVGLGIQASTYGQFAFSGTATFDRKTILNSDVILMANGIAGMTYAHNDTNLHLFFTGGGLGAGLNGHKFVQTMFAYMDDVNVRLPWAGSFKDLSPGSDPTYGITAWVSSLNGNTNSIAFEDQSGAIGGGTPSNPGTNSGWLTIMEVVSEVPYT